MFWEKKKKALKSGKEVCVCWRGGVATSKTCTMKVSLIIKHLRRDLREQDTQVAGGTVFQVGRATDTSRSPEVEVYLACLRTREEAFT